MMLKQKSNPWARLKYLYVLPLTAVAVTAFARPEISGELEKISSVKVIESLPVTQANGQEKKIRIVRDTVSNAVQVSDNLNGEVVGGDSALVMKKSVVKVTSSDSVVVVGYGTQQKEKGMLIRSLKEKPLIVIDGVEMSEADLSTLDTETIESVSVLKDHAAEELYKEKGKNGVIQIVTKKK